MMMMMAQLASVGSTSQRAEIKSRQRRLCEHSAAADLQTSNHSTRYRVTFGGCLQSIVPPQ